MENQLSYRIKIPSKDAHANIKEGPLFRESWGNMTWGQGNAQARPRKGRVRKSQTRMDTTENIKREKPIRETLVGKSKTIEVPTNQRPFNIDVCINKINYSNSHI